MLHCPVCGAILSDDGSVIEHYRILHKHNAKFTCIYRDCLRSYDSWDSYRKHLCNFHKIIYKKEHIQENLFCITKSPNLDCKNDKVDHAENSVKSVQHVSSFTGKTKSDFDISSTDYINNDKDKQNVDINLFLSQTLYDLKVELEKEAEVFVSELCDDSKISHKTVQKIVLSTAEFVNNHYLKKIKEATFKVLDMTDSKTNVHESVITKSILNNIGDPFVNLKTEYNRDKYFKNRETYIQPQKYVIGYVFRCQTVKRQVRARTVPVEGTFIPLRSSLKGFLELPDCHTSIEKYVKNLQSETNTISDITQSKLWKAKLKNYKETDVVLPLFVYQDDFQANNPLGGHSCSLSAVYATIACLPPELHSSLKNIFLFALFNSSHRKKYGNKAVFKPVINELKYLEEVGIEVNINNENVRIYFVLALVIGDNLGINSIFGFVESFSANFFCRFCKTHKSVTQTSCELLKENLRTKINYAIDVIECDYKKTGIKSECIFNEIVSFHVLLNWFVDKMHDIIEGVCNYDLVAILYHYIYKVKYFTLDMLNARIEMFDYGPIFRNKPGSIEEHHIKVSHKLKFTAAEMDCFVRILPFLIGNFITEDDEWWELYLILREIVDIVSAKYNVSIHTGQKMKLLSFEHNKLYMRLTQKPIPPKGHNLEHYEDVFTESGPFALYSCMRFEAKHKELNDCANSTVSRINLPYSIAKKIQIKLSCRLTANESVLPKTVKGPNCSKRNKQSFISFCNEHNFTQYLSESVELLKWIEYKNIYYTKDFIVTLGLDDCHAPKFGRIEHILLLNDTDVIFICKKVENIGLNMHLSAWEISDRTEFFIVKISQLYSVLPLWSHVTSCGEKYVIFN